MTETEKNECCGLTLCICTLHALKPARLHALADSNIVCMLSTSSSSKLLSLSRWPHNTILWRQSVTRVSSWGSAIPTTPTLPNAYQRDTGHTSCVIDVILFYHRLTARPQTTDRIPFPAAVPFSSRALRPMLSCLALSLVGKTCCFSFPLELIFL